MHNLLGFVPVNLPVYKLAFRHRSSQAVKSGKISNERLEYLGDAVLGAVVADMLFKKFPYKDEGFLTRMRSKIVSRDQMNKLALKMGLDKLIDKEGSNGRSMYGDSLEALIGAVYLDKGYARTKKYVLKRIIDPLIDLEDLLERESNFKSKLIEWAQREKKEVQFKVVQEEKCGAHMLYHVCAILEGIEAGLGRDFSRKKAEQAAAEETCRQIGI